MSFLMYESDASYFQARRVEKRVIEKLSISVHAGEIVAVVGASGSGKSLLCSALMAHPR